VGFWPVVPQLEENVKFMNPIHHADHCLPDKEMAAKERKEHKRRHFLFAIFALAAIHSGISGAGQGSTPPPPKGCGAARKISDISKNRRVFSSFIFCRRIRGKLYFRAQIIQVNPSQSRGFGTFFLCANQGMSLSQRFNPGAVESRLRLDKLSRRLNATTNFRSELPTASKKFRIIGKISTFFRKNGLFSKKFRVYFFWREGAIYGKGSHSVKPSQSDSFMGGPSLSFPQLMLMWLKINNLQ